MIVDKGILTHKNTEVKTSVLNVRELSLMQKQKQNPRKETNH